MLANYTGNRFLNRISDYMVHGDHPKKSQETSIHILNLSDYDLYVNISSHDSPNKIIVYPFTIQYFKRLEENELMTINGMDINTQPYSIDFTRNDFKRKNNAIEGSFDESKLRMHPTQRIWLQMILNKSDIFQINQTATVKRKKDEEIKRCWVLDIVVLFFVLSLIISVTIVCFEFIYFIKS